MDRVVSVTNFRFKTLRKYLRSIYWELHQARSLTEAQKKALVHQLIPNFFRRLREYRGVEVESVARSAGWSVHAVQAFEGERGRGDKSLELAYCRTCGGFEEYYYLSQLVHEFMHPSVKQTKYDVALDAARRFGVVFPTVDYKSIHSPRGQVLEFPGAKT